MSLEFGLVTTADSHSPTSSVAKALGDFRRIPVALLVVLGACAVVGAGVALVYATRDAVATCGDRVMSPGETCTLRVSRRSLAKRDWTYEQRLEFSQYENVALTVAGVVVAVIALGMIVAVLVRRARDLAVVDSLADAEQPIASYARTNGLLTGALSLGACIAGGAAALFGVRALRGPDPDVVVLLVAAGVAALAVAMLVAGRPGGATLVCAYPSTVRVVSRSKVHDIAWHDMHYTTSLAAEPTTMLSWRGHGHLLEVTDKDFFATMRTRINDAVRTVLPQRIAAGELVDFRRVTVDGSSVTVDGRAVPGQDIAAVVPVRTKDTDVFEFRDRHGKAVRTVRVTEVANVDVLLELLSSRFGIRLSRG